MPEIMRNERKTMRKLQIGDDFEVKVTFWTVPEDFRLDGEVLLPYDLKASGAHAAMLAKISVISKEEPLE